MNFRRNKALPKYETLYNGQRRYKKYIRRIRTNRLYFLPRGAVFDADDRRMCPDTPYVWTAGRVKRLKFYKNYPTEVVTLKLLLSGGGWKRAHFLGCYPRYTKLYRMNQYYNELYPDTPPKI